MAQVTFEWVNSSTGRVVETPETRKRIRKQAMKQIALDRKRTGNYGKHNRRQLPVFVNPESEDSSESSESPEPPEGLEVYHKQPIRISRSIPASMGPDGYELMRKKYNYEIDLSALTSLDIGRAYGNRLRANPYQLIPLLRNRQSSFLTFLPARYGYFACLDDATDCLMARIHHFLIGDDDMVAGLYGKALKSLQAALNNPEQRCNSEVLCATQLLGLYELFNSRESAWSQHSAGSADLIRLRGPRNYDSEFERGLFMGHAGPMITEALLNNEHCFLEKPVWAALFKRMEVEDGSIPDRSEIVISLMIIFSQMPGLLRDVTDVVCGGVELPYDLKPRLLKYRADLLQWQEKFGADVLCGLSPASPEYSTLAKLLRVYSSCSMMCLRMMTAISPICVLEMEKEVQKYADHVVELYELVKRTGDTPSFLFMSQKILVAEATIATSQEWQQSRTDDHGNVIILIKKKTFERWCSLFGRSTSNGVDY